ncbi:putative methenyltetrahydrofolate cyclohydrolase, Methylenetetrahydrofolate dehydrogenase (NADP(+)) [Helianthus debilis subsp. tardiflorus]
MKWNGLGQMQTFCFMYVITLCSHDTQDNKGSHVTGDVCYEEAIVKSSLLTPVPRGVGPVTISMLLCNTVEDAKHAYQWTEKIIIICYETRFWRYVAMWCREGSTYTM